MRATRKQGAILAMALLGAAACAERETPPPAPEARAAAPRGASAPRADRPPAAGIDDPLLLVAIDGFEWEVVLELVARGEMPRIAGLMESGRYGLLETTTPTFSPIIWTTVATAKTHHEHGIRGFVRKSRGPDEPRRLFTSLDRRSKAFWNILSDFGKRVAVIGWWMTYPVEDVNGVMVAQVNTLEQADRSRGRAILKGGIQEGLAGQVHPPERLDEVLAIHRRVSEELPRLTERIFGGFERPLSPLATRLWENTLWAFRSDATYLEITRRLGGEDFDLVAFYLGGPDVVGHRFWRYMKPELYEHPPAAEEQEELGEVVADYYRYVDEAVGGVLDAMPSRTSVLIVSDHGMHAVNRERPFDPQEIPRDVKSAHHHGAHAGVVIASGPAFAAAGGGPAPARREELPSLGSVFDVTPSLLALMGIPVGRDMQGRPLVEIFADPDTPVRSLASHETREWLLARSRLDSSELARSGDEERLEQLRALGYIN